MALQICPVCQQERFTWFMQEDDTGRELTHWNCGACKFGAYELEESASNGVRCPEHFARACASCSGTLGTRLYQDDQQYLWCSSCNRLTEQPTSAETT